MYVLLGSDSSLSVLSGVLSSALTNSYLPTTFLSQPPSLYFISDYASQEEILPSTFRFLPFLKEQNHKEKKGLLRATCLLCVQAHRQKQQKLPQQYLFPLHRQHNGLHRPMRVRTVILRDVTSDVLFEYYNPLLSALLIGISFLHSAVGDIPRSSQFP